MQTPKRFTRRSFLRSTTRFAAAALALPLAPNLGSAVLTSFGKRPVILATDIGDDIDDTWALGFLLKCPELDLKLVVGEHGKRDYRAKLLAKFLQTVHHGKVPIAMGMDIEPRGEGPQAGWLKGYDLSAYRGKVHPDATEAIIETIMKSREPVTVIAIGPIPNLSAALEREPGIARRARLVGMYGSVRKGYDGKNTPEAEWNVKANPKACQTALTAAWDITITPLDTCGLVTLAGDRYRKVRNSQDRIASTIIENYRLWSTANKQAPEVAESRSSTLFDTVAVYLAFSQAFCTMERLGIRVTDDGFTLIDEHAKPMDVATDWKSLDGYCDFLVRRLTT